MGVSKGVDKSVISPKDLEAMIFSAARALDGKAAEFLGELQVEPEMRLSVQERLGYERIAKPSTVEEGKTLLQGIINHGRQLNYDRVLDHVYSHIKQYSLFNLRIESDGLPPKERAKKLVSELSRILDVAQFVKGLGHEFDLDNLWISYKHIPGDCFGGYYEISKEPKVEYRRKWGIKKPIFEPVRVNGYALLKEQIIQGLRDDSIMDNLSDEQIINMLKRATQIGVAINPDDIAKVGYDKLKLIPYEHGTRVLGIAQSLGAHIEPTVLAVIDRYQQLKSQQTKA